MKRGLGRVFFITEGVGLYARTLQQKGSHQHERARMGVQHTGLSREMPFRLSAGREEAQRRLLKQHAGAKA